MKNIGQRSAGLTSQQAMRVVYSLCHQYSIPTTGDQLVALIGEGYECQNINAMKNWTKKQAKKVSNQNDISEWAALLKSDLKRFGVELMD